MDQMKQLNVSIENCFAPKAVPVFVPLAYQAIIKLQEKIDQANELNMKVAGEKANAEQNAIPLWQRYSLSVTEAARYFGIGETRIYQIIAEHPRADFILEIGSHVKIKRVLFERYLDAASCV